MQHRSLRQLVSLVCLFFSKRLAVYDCALDDAEGLAAYVRNGMKVDQGQRSLVPSLLSQLFSQPCEKSCERSAAVRKKLREEAWVRSRAKIAARGGLGTRLGSA